MFKSSTQMVVVYCTPRKLFRNLNSYQFLLCWQLLLFFLLLLDSKQQTTLRKGWGDNDNSAALQVIVLHDVSVLVCSSVSSQVFPEKYLLFLIGLDVRSVIFRIHYAQPFALNSGLIRWKIIVLMADNFPKSSLQWPAIMQCWGEEAEAELERGAPQLHRSVSIPPETFCSKQLFWGMEVWASLVS